MLPDLSEYKWIIPDFVWELDEYIDLGWYQILSWLLILPLYTAWVSNQGPDEIPRSNSFFLQKFSNPSFNNTC